MIVPELPADVRALKEAVGRFVEDRGLPARDAHRRARIDRSRRARGASAQGARCRLRDAQHAARARRPRPPDARPGRARGGVRQGDERARLRRRRSWPARAARDRDSRSGRALRASHRGGPSIERRGLSPSRAPAPTSPRSRRRRFARRRRVGAERREVVRDERGRARRLHRSRRRRGRADAVPRRPGDARLGDPAHAVVPPRSVHRPPPRGRLHATAAFPTRTACLRAATRERRSGSSSSGSSSPPAAAALRSGSST